MITDDKCVGEAGLFGLSPYPTTLFLFMLEADMIVFVGLHQVTYEWSFSPNSVSTLRSSYGVKARVQSRYAL